MVEWKILNMNRRATDGFVVRATWEAIIKETDQQQVHVTGVCTWKDGDLITPYENLNEQQVLGWVWSKIDKLDIEQHLESKMESLKNPKIEQGVPWTENR